MVNAEARSWYKIAPGIAGWTLVERTSLICQRNHFKCEFMGGTTGTIRARKGQIHLKVISSVFILVKFGAKYVSKESTSINSSLIHNSLCWGSCLCTATPKRTCCYDTFAPSQLAVDLIKSAPPVYTWTFFFNSLGNVILLSLTSIFFLKHFFCIHIWIEDKRWQEAIPVKK